MKVLSQVFKLTSGYHIPKIGLGTYSIKGQQCFDAVKSALDIGYTHIDTGQSYKNEQEIAKAIKNLDRKSLFLSSKVAPYQQGYSKATQAVQNSLQVLQTDYLDLVLVHWPGVFKMSLRDPKVVDLRHQTWKALQDMYFQGKIRSIGVSNFLIRHLDKLIDYGRVKPSVNQVEFHCMYHDDQLLQYCKERNIYIEAYSPLARTDPRLWEKPQLAELAGKYGKSIAQILLRWGYQKGVILLPKSVSAERIKENSEIDFEIEDDDMEILSSLRTGQKTVWDPENILHQQIDKKIHQFQFKIKKNDL